MTAHQKTEKIRNQIIEAANRVLYRKGFNLMSFSDIAAESLVPRGNINYHFNTKDQILKAVIDLRLDKVKHMLEGWNEQISSPQDRLHRYVQITRNESLNISRFGCPIGSLNNELGKIQPELKAVTIRQLDMFKIWLIGQFQEFVPRQNADDLALHLLTMSQGMSAMAYIYGDPSLIAKEADKADQWISNLLGD